MSGEVGRNVPSGGGYSLSSFFAAVYQHVAYGLCIAGGVSFAVSQSPALARLVMASYPLLFVVSLGLCLYLPRAISGTRSLGYARGLYFTFAAVEGLSLSLLSYVYTGRSIAAVFALSALVFFVSAQYGFTTGNDLTKSTGVARAMLLGVVCVSLVNLVMHACGMCMPALHFLVSLVIAAISPMLISGAAQQLSMVYYQYPGERERVVLLGALQLLVMFINLFISLLRLFGSRRED